MFAENLSPFERLLWDGWMPNMRKAALQWSPRDDTFSMLRVVEKWLPFLPSWLCEHLLDKVLKTLLYISLLRTLEHTFSEK